MSECWKQYLLDRRGAFNSRFRWKADSEWNGRSFLSVAHATAGCRQVVLRLPTILLLWAQRCRGPYDRWPKSLDCAYCIAVVGAK